MKPSGLGWAGDIPNDWDVAKICLVARLESGHTPSRQHPEYWIPEECTIPWFSLADVWQLRDGIREYLGETSEKISAVGMANSAARLLPAGTVVLSRTASVGFTGIMPMPMATTQDFANWIPGDRLLSEFLLFALRAMNEEFQRATMGSTHQTIYMPDIRRLTIPIPSRDEQARVVRFLHRRLPMCDDLVAKKERLVALLTEKRQALITEAVTKGLDRNAPMKESGLEWIGRVPAHWEIRRLKQIASRIVVGIAQAATHAYADSGVPIVRSTNVRPNSIALDDLLYIEQSFADQLSSKYIYPGDLLTVRTGNAGVTAVVPSALARCQCFTMLITTLRRPHVPDFVSYQLNSDMGRVYFSLEGWGTAQANISVPILQNAPVVVPPAEEQVGIVEWIRKRSVEIDAAIGSATIQVDRLREYRQALITAAVTGKLEVPREDAA
jgi:type I restriction enzyme S subunit